VPENLFFKLGRGSIKEAKEVLRKILPELGEIGVYLDNDAELQAAYRELLILMNIRFLEEIDKDPGSIRLDFFKAYVKSKRKLVLSDEEIEGYEEELL